MYSSTVYTVTVNEKPADFSKDELQPTLIVSCEEKGKPMNRAQWEGTLSQACVPGKAFKIDFEVSSIHFDAVKANLMFCELLNSWSHAVSFVSTLFLCSPHPQIAKDRDMVAIAEAMLDHKYAITTAAHGGKCLSLDGAPIDALPPGVSPPTSSTE